MSRLPAAEWTGRADLARLVDALGSERVRWVGGAVRDTLLGAPVRDVDAATILRPDAVIVRCRDAGIATVPTGIAHGTITAVLPGGNVELTTLRRDVATDGRRATVAFSDRWEEDAARRDFTINALYAHPATLEIEDYVGGRADLEARRVRFIGAARERIAEDRLRILRYYRFQARFGAELDAEAEAACAEMAPSMSALSAERIAQELLALLALPDPPDTVARMLSNGVLPVVLPELCPSGAARLRALIATERAASIAPDPLRRLAALLPPEPSRAEDAAKRLKLSNAARARLVAIAARARSDAMQPPRARLSRGAGRRARPAAARGRAARSARRLDAALAAADGRGDRRPRHRARTRHLAHPASGRNALDRRRLPKPRTGVGDARGGTSRSGRGLNLSTECIQLHDK